MNSVLKQFYTCQSDYVIAIDDGRILMKMVEMDSKMKQRMVYVRLTEVYRSLNQIECPLPGGQAVCARTSWRGGSGRALRLTTTLLETTRHSWLPCIFNSYTCQVKLSPSFRQLTFGRSSYPHRHPDKSLSHHGQPNSCRCHGQVGAPWSCRAHRQQY